MVSPDPSDLTATDGLPPDTEPLEPLAPEVTDPSAETTETVPVDAPAPDPSPRGPDGRFVVRDPPAADGAPPLDGTLVPPPEAPPPEPPWGVKYDGQFYTLPDAKIVGETLVIPRQHEHLLHTLIGRGLKADHERSVWQQERATQQRARATFAAEQQAYQAKVQAIEGVLKQILDEPDDVKAAALIMDLRANRDALQREAALAAREVQLSHRETALQPSPEQQQHAFEEGVTEQAVATFREAKAAPWATGLTDADWNALGDVAWDVRMSFVVRADRDYPEHGITAGETVFNAAAFGGYLEKQASLLLGERRRATHAQTAAKATADAAKRNAAALQLAITAPPGVTGQGGARRDSATSPPATAYTADDWAREMGLTK